MQTFLRNEEQMREYMRNALDGLFPFNPIEEMNKQNIALFESAIKMFAPFYQPPPGADQAGNADQTGQTAEATIQELRARLNTIQQQLDALNKAEK
jgi:polyhydroxyalkanoate synthesis regulator protein